MPLALLKYGFSRNYPAERHFPHPNPEAGTPTTRGGAAAKNPLGFDSELIYPKDIRKLSPPLNPGEDAPSPTLGALYPPRGAIARHDAVAWGYARGAAALGV